MIRMSTSRPRAWVSWPGMSPPCSKLTSPMAIGPRPASPIVTAAARTRPDGGARAPMGRSVADLVAAHPAAEDGLLEVADQVTPCARVDAARDGKRRVSLERADGRDGGAGERAVDRETCPPLVVELALDDLDRLPSRARREPDDQTDPRARIDGARDRQATGRLEGAHGGRRRRIEDAGDVEARRTLVAEQSLEARTSDPRFPTLWCG